MSQTSYPLSRCLDRLPAGSKSDARKIDNGTRAPVPVTILSRYVEMAGRQNGTVVTVNVRAAGEVTCRGAVKPHSGMPCSRYHVSTFFAFRQYCGIGTANKRNQTDVTLNVTSPRSRTRTGWYGIRQRGALASQRNASCIMHSCHKPGIIVWCCWIYGATRLPVMSETHGSWWTGAVNVDGVVWWCGQPKPPVALLTLSDGSVGDPCLAEELHER